MYAMYRTSRFEKSFKRLKKSGLLKPSVKSDLEKVIDLLARGKTLPVEYHDHALTGDLKGYRDCHIQGDLLLIYELDVRAKTLTLVDIGNHANIFG
jgi:mRNA interferase YafQ